MSVGRYSRPRFLYENLAVNLFFPSFVLSIGAWRNFITRAQNTTFVLRPDISRDQNCWLISKSTTTLWTCGPWEPCSLRWSFGRNLSSTVAVMQTNSWKSLGCLERKISLRISTSTTLSWIRNTTIFFHNSQEYHGSLLSMRITKDLSALKLSTSLTSCSDTTTPYVLLYHYSKVIC